MILNKIRSIKTKNDFFKLLKQFIKFGFVGISNTLLSLMIYYLLVYLGVDFIIANTIAFIISVLNAYYWNNKYVFKKTSQGHFKALLRTYVAYSFTFAMATGLLYLMVNNIGISKYVAPIINLSFTIPINFLINKFWAFK